MARVFCAFCVCCLTLPAVFAQSIQGQPFVVNKGPIAAHLEPSASSIVVRTIEAGTRVTGSEARNGWYRVRLPMAPTDRAAIYGWIPADVLSPAAEAAPESPAAVERTEAAPLPPPTPQAAPPAAPVPAPRVERARPSPAPRAQPEERASGDRGWVDVNLGIAHSASGGHVFTFGGILDSEPFALAAAYPSPSLGADFDFGGGAMLTPLFGVGLSISGTGHVDTAGLGATIPHPYFFGASATASGSTGELTRSEGAVHFQAMVVPLRSESMRLRIFGGPTFFRYEADMVRDIAYTQLALPFSVTNLVEIHDYDAVKATGTGWGAHVGVDYGYFFSRVVGVGGLVRFSLGTATIDEPLSEVPQHMRVGGFQSAGGLRIRF